MSDQTNVNQDDVPTPIEVSVVTMTPSPTIHERPYTEAQFRSELAQLCSYENMETIWLDQARFNGLRHFKSPALVGVYNTEGHHWEFDGIPMYIFNTNGARRLDVDLKDSDRTLKTKYSN